MRATFIALCTAAALAGSARPANAGWLLTPFAGATIGASTGYFEPDNAVSGSKIAFGVALTKTGGRFSFEGDVARVPGFFTGDSGGLITSSSVTTVTGNVLWNLPSLGKLQPYAAAGAGALRVDMQDEANVFPVGEWRLAFSLGAGVTAPISDRLSLRGDGRYTRTRYGDGAGSSIGFGETYVGFWRLTAGLAIRIR